jgi:hypothetical protein
MNIYTSEVECLRDKVKQLEEALAKQEGQSNFCPQCEALARELKAAKQEQGEPVGEGRAIKLAITEANDKRLEQEQGELVTADEKLARMKSELAYMRGQQEQGEPVGTVGELFDDRIIWKRELDRDLLVYTTPQQRKPLTEEQLIDLWPSLIMHQHTYAFARAIEAAHGIKE